MDLRAMVAIALIVCSTTVFVVKIVVDAVVRMRERSRSLESGELARRLERMEAAIDSIAIEVERSGELQRFSARIEQKSRGRALPRDVARPITPH